MPAKQEATMCQETDSEIDVLESLLARWKNWQERENKDVPIFSEELIEQELSGLQVCGASRRRHIERRQ